MVFLREIHVFLKLSWIGQCGWKCAFSTLKSLFGRQFSFLKLAQFSERINELHVAHSNIYAFLFRDTCVSLIQLNRPIWNKMCILPLDNADWKAVFHEKTTSVLTEKQCARCSTFNHGYFSFTDKCVSSTQLNMPFWNKFCFSPN
jgi:hypothetical protein